MATGEDRSENAPDHIGHTLMYWLLTEAVQAAHVCVRMEATCQSGPVVGWGRLLACLLPLVATTSHCHLTSAADLHLLCRHATIAEAFMAVAVVTDDTALFAKAVELFKATTTNYLRWGRDPAYSTGRIVGECTETLRVGHQLVRGQPPVKPRQCCLPNEYAAIGGHCIHPCAVTGTS